jgi:hypothetical protein
MPSAAALLRAMRTWRIRRRGLDEADRLVAGDPAGPGNPGLDHLLGALRAPATTAETGGGRVTAAALAAERRRAAQTTGRKGRLPASARTIVVTTATVVALLSGGTAVAAGTGSLPAGLQQHAHRLFSALGVPAPGTGPSAPTPAPATSAPDPVTPAPTKVTTAATATSPTPAPTRSAEQVAWCQAWQVAADGGHPMNGRDRRDLIAAAGGEEKVATYCGLPTASATTTKPGRRASPSHPVKPSHPGKKK